jgi:hypothetical protein
MRPAGGFCGFRSALPLVFDPTAMQCLALPPAQLPSSTVFRGFENRDGNLLVNDVGGPRISNMLYSIHSSQEPGKRKAEIGTIHPANKTSPTKQLPKTASEPIRSLLSRTRRHPFPNTALKHHELPGIFPDTEPLHSPAAPRHPCLPSVALASPGTKINSAETAILSCCRFPSPVKPLQQRPATRFEAKEKRTLCESANPIRPHTDRDAQGSFNGRRISTCRGSTTNNTKQKGGASQTQPTDRPHPSARLTATARLRRGRAERQSQDKESDLTHPHPSTTHSGAGKISGIWQSETCQPSQSAIGNIPLSSTRASRSAHSTSCLCLCIGTSRNTQTSDRCVSVCCDNH